MIMDLRQQTAAFPCAIVVVDAGPRRQIFGKIAPLAASFVDVKNPVEDLQVRVFSGSAKARGFGETVGNEVPFGLGEIRCISHPNAKISQAPLVEHSNITSMAKRSKRRLNRSYFPAQGTATVCEPCSGHRTMGTRHTRTGLNWQLSK